MKSDSKCTPRVLLLLITWLYAQPAMATHPCTSPLILDLDGDQIQTTGLEHPVEFDIDADGHHDSLGWVGWDGEDPFLWLDLNHNGAVDDGSELFGSATLLPSGRFARDGFQALSVYDRPPLGGNRDGLISREDLIWSQLKLWRDFDHNGMSSPSEISSLYDEGIVLISLEAERVDTVDGHGNLWALRGSFVKRVEQEGRTFQRRHEVWDIFFIFEEDDHDTIDIIDSQ